MIRQAFAALIALLVAAAPAAAIETEARAAMVVDHATGTVLMKKNADEPLPPASMSKLMTLFMVFEALDQGRLSLDDTFRVSEKAWQMGGSKMFLRAGDDVTVENLLRGVIVQSGNDACVVLAEGLAGTEEAFADQMTQRARELGLTDSVFANSTGWPHPEHRMSARDLVRLAGLIIDRFPQYYPYFAETTFTWEGIEQTNRNPLLGLSRGADGLKTGHTEAAGYGLVGSAVRDGRRVTMMVTGLDSARARLVESERLIDWAFREFAVRELFPAGEPLAEAGVWLGAAPSVPLAPAAAVEAVVPWTERENLTVSIEYDGPLPAPIAAGDRVAELVIEAPGLEPVRHPLVATTDVAEGGFVTRLRTAAGVLFDRALAAAFPAEG